MFVSMGYRCAKGKLYFERLLYGHLIVFLTLAYGFHPYCHQDMPFAGMTSEGVLQMSSSCPF